MKDFDRIFADLKQMRDELTLKMHLGSKEAQEQWSSLEKKWEKFASEARLEESATDIGAAARGLGKELQAGYEKIRKTFQ